MPRPEPEGPTSTRAGEEGPAATESQEANRECSDLEASGSLLRRVVVVSEAAEEQERGEKYSGVLSISSVWPHWFLWQSEALAGRLTCGCVFLYMP